MKTNKWILAGMAFVAAATLQAADNAQATPAAKSNTVEPNGCANLPSYAQLKRALSQARAADTSGSNAQQWATIVDRHGVVCAVAFTGYDTTSEGGFGRVSSAMRASSANDFSFDSSSASNGAGNPGGLALSTANLYTSTQPGGFVGGISYSYPVNQAAVFSTQVNAFGTPADPMVGQIVGGFIGIGGGVGLFAKGQVAVGGLGVAGDHSCTDHNVAYRTRNLLGLDHLAGFPPLSGDPSRPDNIVYDITPNPSGGIGVSASGLGHPRCPNLEQPGLLPAVQP
jgi:hypothetical protein